MTQPTGTILLTELVQNHAADLYRYAYRLCGSSADAEDLVQQTFVLAQQNLPSLRDPHAARAWLFALLRSAFCRLVRKQRPVPETVAKLELDQLVAPEEPPNEF